ncbi:MAG: bifunctional riboflavin kinase/FAD synthetase [Gammaproteobacteria bacterium]|jgi:riboflavin kinase/FMN adenylyltransferase|nr:bifunctional riboflavin kinase/FAD synthetase [Gammaproteobacteria bacterium]
MQLIRRPDSNPSGLAGGSVCTIGTFDGVHLGHRRILERVLAVAAKQGLPAVVISFEPTPREFFTRGEPPARLTRFREKFTEFQRLGFDWFFCPPFDAHMESLEPDAFISQLLVATLHVQNLVVGDDFVFGRARSGTVADLQRAGSEYGFSVEQAETVLEKTSRVSSTSIRQALAAGDMARATRMLGRPYSMTGRVVDGQKLGKELGFPTANVNLNRRASPIAGIFAVRIDGLGPTLLNGVASVGTRPTVGGTVPLLEVHIFDFDRDIYGEYIQVDFVQKLRDEVHFPDLETLTEQMHIDAAEARQILAC